MPVPHTAVSHPFVPLRPRRPSWALVAGLAAVVALLAAVGGAAPARASVAASPRGWAPAADGTYAGTTVSVPYAGVPDPQRTMDVTVPAAAPAGRPIVVLIHPGGYYQGDKATVAGFAAHLASRGYVTVNLNYRLSTRPDGAWPAQRVDLDRALLWTRAHAGRWAADPTRIGVLGTSAGGHLAMFAAGQPGVRAIAVWSPMVDPYDIAYVSRRGTVLGNRLVSRTARCTYAACPATWTQGLRPDGYGNLRPTVPVYAANSTSELIDARPLLRYAKQVRSRGGVFRVSLIPGSAHASGAAYVAVAWPGTLAHLARYL